MRLFAPAYRAKPSHPHAGSGGFACSTPSLVAKIRELEARQQALRSEIAALRPVPRLDPAVVEDRLAEWRRLLRQSTTQGRAVLQRVLRGRITFTPYTNPYAAEGYTFTAQTRFDKLFAGIATPRPAFIETVGVGTEGIRVEDTPDADYGHLLEQVYGKGVTSPTGTGRLWYAPLRNRIELAA